jgi:hypothetical protein
MVPTATPIMEMMEITLMKFCFLREKKYRLAMKYERFKQGNGLRAWRSTGNKNGAHCAEIQEVTGAGAAVWARHVRKAGDCTPGPYFFT